MHRSARDRRASERRDGAPVRILLVRPDHLGDVLLTLPAVVALRRALPDAHLTFLVADPLRELVSRCPAIDDVRTLPFPAPDASFDPPEWREVLRTAAPALAGRFDVAVLLRPEDPWSGALVQAAGIPVRVGYAQAGTRPFVSHALPPESRDRHGVELAAALLERVASLLGASLGPVRREERVLVPTEDDERRADGALATLNERSTERPIVLHPGSGWRLKNWPVNRWGRLARALAENHGCRAVVLGAPAERETCARVVAASAAAAVTVPPISLATVAALHRRARVVVSVDSGAAHLAALVGAPVVALFGPGDPRMASPWCPPDRLRIVRVDLECSPCGRMHDPPCGATELPACVHEISVERVRSAIDELLRLVDVPPTPGVAADGRITVGDPRRAPWTGQRSCRR